MSILDSLLRKTASDKDAEDRLPAYAEALDRRDYAVALPLLQQAIKKEDACAMGAYAALLALGRGVEKNPQEAYCWFRQGANRGDLKSQVSLGMCLAGGTGTPIDRVEAAYWLYRAGRAGSLEAISILAELSDRDHSIVGPHFSEDELIDLVYHFRNELKRKAALESALKVPASKLVH